MIEIPGHMQEHIDRWVREGAPHPDQMGSFLRYLLLNDLVHTCMHADERNRAAIVAWAMYLYNEVPTPAWGSAERLLAWHQHNGLKDWGKAA